MRREIALAPALLFVAALVHAQQLPIKTYTAADGLPHNTVNRVVRDSRGFLWFCTAEGLSRFDGLKLMVEGHHYKTAAREMGISVNTVSFHLKHVYDKLQVHSKSEAVAKALRERLL